MTRGLLVEEFDLWQPTYAGAVVNVYQTGTTTPATLFFDEDMTDPAPNPQTLISFTDESGIEYGRFFRSVYSQQAYYLDIGTLQQTGNHRLPLADLVGVDASQAVATATGATQSRTLAAHFADVINVQDFGAWKPTTDGTASPATNNATLTAAIGAAAAQGGGFVVLPAGSYEITGVNVPGNVMICGRGKGVSTLVCKTGAACFTVTGDKAGFRDVTLDGVDLVASSIGLTGNNRTGILLERCEVKRFETGILFRGGSRHLYKELFVGNCTYNVRLLGDSASSGGAIFGFDWHGGQSITATNTAIELHQVDQTVQHIRLRGVSISSNTPSNAALYIEGCQFIDLENCIWESNTGHNVWLRDDVTTSLESFESAAVTFTGGLIDGANILLDGLSRNVLLDRMDLRNLEIQANIPTGAIILRDCIETATSISGDTLKVERQTTRQRGLEAGISTSATPLVAWQRPLVPGQVLAVEAVITATYRNGLGFAQWKICQAAHQLGATLLFNTQSVNYTVGNTIQGQSSGATGVITAQADAGATGSLTLTEVSGTFINGELITEISPGTGSARANGTLTINATALMGTLTTLDSALDAVATADAIAVAFDCNGSNMRLLVTGAAAKTIRWTANMFETPSF